MGQPHKHYDMIVKWASDPERYRVVHYPLGGGISVDMSNPSWLEDHEYEIVDTYSEPVSKPLKFGTEYWIPDPSDPDFVTECEWLNDDDDLLWFHRGMVYLSEEAAAVRGKKMLEA